MYASVNELSNNVPEDYQYHGNEEAYALQPNFFAASGALNAQITNWENRLVAWLQDNRNYGRVDATNFNVDNCDNVFSFLYRNCDTNKCSTNTEEMQEYLLWGRGEIRYYKGTLVRDENNHITYNIDLNNSCTINTHGEDDCDIVFMP